MNDKIYISWDEFHRQVKTLTEKIKQHGNFNRIIAISRGGLIPAAIIAYELDIRNCDVINMSTYDGEAKRDEGEIEISPLLSAVDEKSLIIDDLADSGRTLQILRRLYPRAVTACVYAKPAGQPHSDIYAAAVPDRWVVFPWD